MTAKNVKIKITLPKGANVISNINSDTKDLVLYEIDKLDILEEVHLGNQKVNFQAKDGQYVNKGDVIFTEGVLGHRMMIADFSGIVEIKSDVCRILGQKKTISKKINLPGKVIKSIPGKYVLVEAEMTKLKLPLYLNSKPKLTQKVYFNSKNDIKKLNITGENQNKTFFINDNFFIDDLSKIIAFGVKRLIVNSVYINNVNAFHNEINKLEAFGIISGFGEFVSRKIILKDDGYDIFWGKNHLFLADQIEKSRITVYEHPFWGITGNIHKKTNLVSMLEYNDEKIDVYLKNIKFNEQH
jgi:hypothetical protein